MKYKKVVFFIKDAKTQKMRKIDKYFNVDDSQIDELINQYFTEFGMGKVEYENDPKESKLQNILLITDIDNE